MDWLFCWNKGKKEKCSLFYVHVPCMEDGVKIDFGWNHYEEERTKKKTEISSLCMIDSCTYCVQTSVFVYQIKTFWITTVLIVVL